MSLEFNPKLSGKCSDLRCELIVNPGWGSQARGVVMGQDKGPRPSGQKPGKKFAGVKVHMGPNATFDDFELAPVPLPVLRPEADPFAGLQACFEGEAFYQLCRPRSEPFSETSGVLVGFLAE